MSVVILRRFGHFLSTKPEIKWSHVGRWNNRDLPFPFCDSVNGIGGKICCLNYSGKMNWNGNALFLQWWSYSKDMGNGQHKYAICWWLCSLVRTMLPLYVLAIFFFFVGGGRICVWCCTFRNFYNTVWDILLMGGYRVCVYVFPTVCGGLQLLLFLNIRYTWWTFC